MGEKRREKSFKQGLTRLAIAGGMFLLIPLWMGNYALAVKLGLSAVFAIVAGLKFALESRENKRGRGKRVNEVNQSEKLPSLPEGYSGFRRISCDEAVVDFVVIGPAGVFVVESGPPNVKVTADGDTLLFDGFPPEKNFISRTWSQAYHIRDLLKERTGSLRPVKPILCFTNACVEVNEPIYRVAVMESGQLSDFITRQKILLSPESVALIAACIETATVGEVGGALR